MVADGRRGLSPTGCPVDDREVTAPLRRLFDVPAAAALAAVVAMPVTSAWGQSPPTASPSTSPSTADPIRIGDLPRAGRPTGPDLAASEDVLSVDLRAIEPWVADRGPLDASLRWVPTGLRLPTGYDQVFRLGDGGLMRADGGLAATFDRSVYQATQWGAVPMIPASTLFVIGGVPMGAEPGHGRLLAVDPLDPGAVPSPTPPTATPDAAHVPTATPGDRLRRFGYGPGHRIADRVDGGIDAEMRRPGSRFTLDVDYRSARLAARLDAWREARAEVTSPVGPTASRPDSAP